MAILCVAIIRYTHKRRAHQPGKIKLLDVYRAVEDGELFALHSEQPNIACAVCRHIQSTLARHFDAATRAMERGLATTTIANVLQSVLRADRKRANARV